MGLRDIEATLPPGFRFYPSDEDLVCHYLYKKIANEKEVDLRASLMEIDLHTCEPWQLPEVAKMNSNEWYFFSFRDRKYATGFGANRATTTGYWKATGKDRSVLDSRTRDIVGMRKTLVFYKNRAPNGIKTGWIMHEFRLENPKLLPKEDWVLCRVFHKSNGGNCNKFMIPQNYYDHDFKGGATNIEQAMSSCYENMNALSHIPPCNYQQDQAQNRRTSLDLSRSILDSGEFIISHDMNEAPSSAYNYDKIVQAKCDDYGFLFNMNFEDYSITEI